MKFAENNRISHRQLYRQMILTFLAPFLICLPGKNGIQGMTGIAGVLAAVILLVIYVFVLLRVTSGYSDMVRFFGRFWGRIAGLFFLAYIILTAVYILKILEQIVPRWLILGVPAGWISFLVVVICSVGTERGIQRRGRMEEVSGGLLLVGILLMMVLCLGQTRVDYLQEMFETERVSGSGVIQSSYLFLCGFSGIGLLPFIMRDVEKRGSAGKIIIASVLTVGGIFAGVLILLPAVFGWRRLLTETYPILPLLAGADLPGNVLARFDVLWMGFLLYGLLFAMGSLFYYGYQITEKCHLNGEILAGNSDLRIVIGGSTRYGCGDILQKLSEKYFCPGTSAHTDGDPFSWTEKENKKNDYSCFADLRVDTERMCGN